MILCITKKISQWRLWFHLQKTVKNQWVCIDWQVLWNFYFHIPEAITHCGLVVPYGDIKLSNGPGNGWLPDDTKPYTWPNENTSSCTGSVNANYERIISRVKDQFQTVEPGIAVIAFASCGYGKRANHSTTFHPSKNGLSFHVLTIAKYTYIRKGWLTGCFITISCHYNDVIMSTMAS